MKRRLIAARRVRSEIVAACGGKTLKETVILYVYEHDSDSALESNINLKGNIQRACSVHANFHKTSTTAAFFEFLLT